MCSHDTRLCQPAHAPPSCCRGRRVLWRAGGGCTRGTTTGEEEAKQQGAGGGESKQEVRNRSECMLAHQPATTSQPCTHTSKGEAVRRQLVVASAQPLIPRTACCALPASSSRVDPPCSSSIMHRWGCLDHRYLSRSGRQLLVAS